MVEGFRFAYLEKSETKINVSITNNSLVHSAGFLENKNMIMSHITPSARFSPQKSPWSAARFSTWVSCFLALTSILGFAGCDIHFTSFDGYSFNYQGETATLNDEGEIAATVETIVIDNRFGNIDINVVQAEETPSWKWNCKVWCPDQEMADKMVKKLVVKVDDEGTTKKLTLLIPETSSLEEGEKLNGVKSNFVIAVPETTKLDLKNAHGNVKLNGMKSPIKTVVSFGDLQLDQYVDAKVDIRHGDALINNGAGKTEIDASHADVSISKTDGDVKFEGSHSAISAVEVSGKIDFETSFDKIIATDIQGDAKLKNSHGDIEAFVLGNADFKNKFGSTKLICGGTRVTGKSSHSSTQVTLTSAELDLVELETSFAGLDVYLPQECQPTIKMKTKFGKTNSAIKPGNGEGGSTVTLNNSHGDIDVHRAK